MLNQYDHTIKNYIVNELINDIDRQGMKTCLDILKKKNMVSLVRKGIYLPTDKMDKFSIGCNSVISGCLAYHSALEYYLLQTQEFNTLYIVSSKRFRPFIYDGELYIHKPHKLGPDIETDCIGNTYPIRVTTINQTIIDCIYNINLAGGLEELLNAMIDINPELLDESGLLRILVRYNNKSLYQRTGYLFSLFREKWNFSDNFYAICKKKAGNNVCYLIDPLKCSTFCKIWNICVPDDILENIKEYEI